MKNHLFFGMFTVAGLLAASCSDEELETPAQAEDEVQVTFTIGVEVSTKTRAIADGENIDKLIYAVFDEECSPVVEKTEINFDGFPVDVTMTLTKDQTYKIAFWAQDASCSAYTVDSDMNVTIDYDTSITKNNDDSRDALFAAKEFSASGPTSIEVTLRRPFAQINACVTEEDWNKAVEAGYTLKQSSMIVESVGTSIDLFTGKVSGTATATFSSSEIPSEDIMFDMDGDGVQESVYKWLSMSYILVNDGSDTGNTRTVLDNLTFIFTAESGDNITVELTDVAAQRNYRTNALGVLGEVLADDTSDGIVTVFLDSSFDGDYFAYLDGGAEKLAQVAANGGSVTLTSDIVLDETLYITAEEGATINLNGYSITLSSSAIEEGMNCIFYVEDGKLTINGEGVVGGTDVPLGYILTNGSGELTINGGTYNGIHGHGYSTISITGGTFNGEVWSIGDTITISGGTFNGEVCSMGDTITISGGTFNGLVNSFGSITIMDGSFDRLKIDNNSPVSISGGTFNESVNCSSDSTIEISGGTFYRSLIFKTESTILISGGTFNEHLSCVGAIEITGGIFNESLSCEGSISITGGTYNGDLDCYGAIIIEDGTFYGQFSLSSDSSTISISGGTFYNYRPTYKFFADGYSSTRTSDDEGNICYVVIETEGIYLEGGADELAQVASDGGTVTLTSDVVLDETLYITAAESVIINLNNHCVTRSSLLASENSLIEVGDGTELVINGEGVVDETDTSASCPGICVNGSGKLTINGGTYNRCLCGIEKSTIAITDGTFNVNIFRRDNSTITTTDGTFNGIVYYLENDESTISRQCESLSGDIVIPESVIYDGTSYTVSYITSSAFRNTKITSITLPDGITSLGECCFYKCSSLISIDLPVNITELGDECFSHCSSLTSIYLPDGITSLRGSCFEGCSSLTFIDLPDSVTELGNTVFNECTSLASVNLPDGITSLGDGCFSHCSSLISIDLPVNITELGGECFSHCSSLTSIYLPDGITSLGDFCFSGCSGITKITCEWTDLDGIEANPNVFENVDSECALYVPEGTKSIYEAKEPWSNFAYIYEYEL